MSDTPRTDECREINNHRAGSAAELKSIYLHAERLERELRAASSRQREAALRCAEICDSWRELAQAGLRNTRNRTLAARYGAQADAYAAIAEAIRAYAATLPADEGSVMVPVELVYAVNVVLADYDKSGGVGDDAIADLRSAAAKGRT